jgi:hypothetical protein
MRIHYSVGHEDLPASAIVREGEMDGGFLAVYFVVDVVQALAGLASYVDSRRAARDAEPPPKVEEDGWKCPGLPEVLRVVSGPSVPELDDREDRITAAHTPYSNPTRARPAGRPDVHPPMWDRELDG